MVLISTVPASRLAAMAAPGLGAGAAPGVSARAGEIAERRAKAVLAQRPAAMAEGVDARATELAGVAVTAGAADRDLEPTLSVRAVLRAPAVLAGPARPWLKGALGTERFLPSAARATSLGLAMLDPARTAAPPGRVVAARLERPQPPIMPVPGRIISEFGESSRAFDEPGIIIAARLGQAVAAPDDGRIVFAGPFKSYGLLLIIEHGREYHTLLWGFSRLEVSIGDDVRTGQIVGVMGTESDPPRALHVELRRNGQPVNPLPWLAASSSKVRG